MKRPKVTPMQMKTHRERSTDFSRSAGFPRVKCLAISNEILQAEKALADGDRSLLKPRKLKLSERWSRKPKKKRPRFEQQADAAVCPEGDLYKKILDTGISRKEFLCFKVRKSSNVLMFFNFHMF